MNQSNSPGLPFRFPFFRWLRSSRGISLLALLIAPLASSPAATLTEARVSQVIRDVKLLPNQAAPRPAQVSDEVRDGTAIRTGFESRAELTFTDATLARLGANTIFSFNQGTRNLELGGGAMLLRVPKDAGGAQITTAAVTASITGTTVLLEYHPDAYIKFMILEGTGRIFRNNRIGESILLNPGQMLIVNPKGQTLPAPVNFDIQRLRKTSLLIKGFRPLASNSLIAHEISNQDALKAEGALLDTNLVIFGSGTTVALLDPTQSNVLDQANANEARRPPTGSSSATPTPTATITPPPTPSPSPTASPSATPTPTITPTPTASPTPEKFGTPGVIASSTPYQIGSGTTIVTDPTITTGGKTDFGKIYRDPTADGPASLWFFGSTSDFDNSIGFDGNIFVGDRAPIAVFKFSALSLIGDPTIIIGEGGPLNLALISVGDLTSGAPGGPLTFAGLNFLFLGTQDGSITLSSNLTFQNIPTLAVYARGAGSNLIFDASVAGTTTLGLLSEGDIRVTNSLSVSQTNTTGLTDGLLISLIAGQAITVGGDLSLTNDATGIANGGSIFIGAGADLTVGGLFGLTVSSAVGNIGNGGSIFVNTGGNLNAGSLNFLLDYNIKGLSITDGADIGLSVGGNLTTTTGSLVMSVLAPIQNTLGNGGDLNLTVGGNLSTAGNNLDLRVVTSRGTQVTDGVNVTGSVGGNLTSGIFSAQMLNESAGGIEIGGNVSFAVGGDLTAQSLLLQIKNSNQGNIDLGGNITLTVNGNLTTNLASNFFLINSQKGHVGTGGNIFANIGGDFSASTVSALIDNSSGGSIDNGGAITFAIGDSFTTTGNASFTILVDSRFPNGAISVAAGTLNIAGSLIARISDLQTSLDFDRVTIGATNDITVGNQLLVQGSVTAGGNISATNGIIIGGGSLAAGGSIISSAGAIQQDFGVSQAGNITAGGNISAAGGLFAFGAPTIVTAGGSIFAPAITAGTLVAGTTITLDNTAGSFSSGLTANSITAGGTLSLINTPAISPADRSSDGTIGNTFADFSLTVGSIISTGPTFPLLSSNGSDAINGSFSNNPGNGGNVAINLTAGGLTIGSTNALTGIQANGGMFLGSSTAGGDGGTIDITATGDVTLNNGDISATSGAFPAATVATRGAGGTVNITAAGAVTVDSKIEVSSNVTQGSPVRRSARGGNISLTSTKPTAGAAITVSNSGQLQALLDQAAPGPGGKITILASGNGGSSVNVHGTAIADRGTVDIRHTGANASVNLSDASGTNSVFLHGDVVKAGALGANGLLTVGRGTLSADDTLKLYGASANGEVRFVDNVTIGGQNFTIIAANTVTINNGRTVNVTGARADVFTGFNGQGIPNANYTGSGGNGSTTGAFGGAGANNPQPIGNAPPFDGPPGG